VMLALTAAAPVFRGWVSDWDCRWNVIAGSVDDRTPEELGEVPSVYRLRKSRYDSVDCYISQESMLKPEYNDVPLVMNSAIKQRLLDEGCANYDLMLILGVDDLLANHIAHLFIRAPLVIFNETINQNDAVDSDHFENLQSTNWQHMRFKPPPPGSNIGWRVEFRSMEIQITDFENAAFAVFIVLVTRVILSFGLDFYIPISKVEEGMQRAHTRDAVLKEKFWFRKNVFPSRRESSRPGTPRGSRPGTPKSAVATVPEWEEMTVEEIINGQKEQGGFPGLVRLVEKYLDSMNVDITTRCEIGRYLSLVSQRASGSPNPPSTENLTVQVNCGPQRNGSVILFSNIQNINTIQRYRNTSITILYGRWRRSRRE
jgi:glutamate--cysteine ligase catalytic subunit